MTQLEHDVLGALHYGPMGLQELRYWVARDAHSALESLEADDLVYPISGDTWELTELGELVEESLDDE